MRSVVQIYLGPPNTRTTLNAESWECAACSRKIQPSTSRTARRPDGAVAQLGTCFAQGSRRLIPIRSTNALRWASVGAANISAGHQHHDGAPIFAILSSLTIEWVRDKKKEMHKRHCYDADCRSHEIKALYDVVTNGDGGCPHREVMKDAASCDKLRGA